MILVSTIGISYLHKKNFVGLNPDKVSYKRGIDLLTAYRFLMRFKPVKKLFGSWKLRHLFINPIDVGQDLYHFFNTVAYTNTPWITTYELSLPRWGEDEMGIKLLARNSCKRIIAMSESARQIQLRILMEKFPTYLKSIEAKLEVIHPYQSKLINTWEEKGITLEGRLKFALVGNDFFRKGGREILSVFQEFIQIGKEFELIVVSNLHPNDYASGATYEDKIKAEQILLENTLHFNWLQNIPNNEVLEIMKSCHVGLLPTYADTYGFSVLEFQSLACPVITTDISALPEINNQEKGWVISIPKDVDREGFYKTPEERLVMSDTIKKGLRRYLNEIFSNPELIREKGILALEDLDRLHSPEKNGMKYFQIYQQAINQKLPIKKG